MFLLCHLIEQLLRWYYFVILVVKTIESHQLAHFYCRRTFLASLGERCSKYLENCYTCNRVEHLTKYLPAPAGIRTRTVRTEGGHHNHYAIKASLYCNTVDSFLIPIHLFLTYRDIFREETFLYLVVYIQKHLWKQLKRHKKTHFLDTDYFRTSGTDICPTNTRYCT